MKLQTGSFQVKLYNIGIYSIYILINYKEKKIIATARIISITECNLLL